MHSGKNKAARGLARAFVLLASTALGGCSGVIGAGDDGGDDGGATAPPNATAGAGYAAGTGNLGPGAAGAGSLPGTGGSTGAGSAGAGPAAFSCDPAAAPAAAPLRRLTRAQYVSVLSDVVRKWAPAAAAEVLAAAPVAAALKGFPDDLRRAASEEKHGGFRRLDQDVQQAHVESGLAVAQAIGAELTRTPARVAALLGTCASDTDTANDAQCVRSFIQNGGQRAHRRALGADDVEFYQTVYGAQGINAAALADVVTVMLSGPYFFYQVEHGGTAVDAAKQTYALDATELASRLSLHFWNTGPDDTLLELARSGALLTEAGYEQALTHVVASPLAKPALEEFFREWLSVEDLLELDRFNGTALFDAVRGNFAPTANTRENMIAEAARLGVHYAQQPNGTFADLFTSKKSFATTNDVATIYGVPTWSGTGEPPNLPDAVRLGILGRAAVVATGSPETRPIMKGVFIRSTLLCDPVPPPPSNAFQEAQMAAEALDPVMSTRDRTVALTEAAGSSCAGCHGIFINPLGFVTETFDSLGRIRMMQPVYDKNGARIGEVPIETETVPQVVTGDMTPVKNLAELSQKMIESEKPQACFARKYFRYATGRVENPAADGCALKSMTDALVANRPLGATLTEIARSNAFKQRRFQ